MITELTIERQEIATAVLEGILPADSLTMEEIEYIERVVNELVEEKILQKSMDQGKIVFSEVENGRLN
jgi:hypothetical protein